MKHSKIALLIAALATELAAPSVLWAQETMTPAHAGMSMADSMTQGLIKKIDKETGKVTIKHGDIKHLDMPGMTMVFDVKDKSLLTPFKVGDKVNFMVVSNNGDLLITDLQAAK